MIENSITEVIKYLENIRDSHGDIMVLVNSRNDNYELASSELGYFDIKEVSFDDSASWNSGPWGEYNKGERKKAVIL